VVPVTPRSSIHSCDLGHDRHRYTDSGGRHTIFCFDGKVRQAVDPLAVVLEQAEGDADGLKGRVQRADDGTEVLEGGRATHSCQELYLKPSLSLLLLQVSLSCSLVCLLCIASSCIAFFSLLSCSRICLLCTWFSSF